MKRRISSVVNAVALFDLVGVVSKSDDCAPIERPNGSNCESTVDMLEIRSSRLQMGVRRLLRRDKAENEYARALKPVKGHPSGEEEYTAKNGARNESCNFQTYNWGR